MDLDYLKFIEEHDPDAPISQYEKVLFMSKRAKELSERDDAAKSLLAHKPVFQAILEGNEGKICCIREGNLDA